MNEIPAFPCGKHESFYIDQCAAWIEANIEIPEYYTAYSDFNESRDNTEYIQFQHNLQAQLMNVTSSDNCPISYRCELCGLDEAQDELEEDEDQDILEQEEQDVLEMTDCERFILECEEAYA